MSSTIIACVGDLDSSLVSAFIFLDHAMSAPIVGGVEGRRLKILAWEAGLALDFC